MYQNSRRLKKKKKGKKHLWKGKNFSVYKHDKGKDGTNLSRWKLKTSFQLKNFKNKWELYIQKSNEEWMGK